MNYFTKTGNHVYTDRNPSKTVLYIIITKTDKAVLIL